jgi:hypothetical protein
VSGVRVSAICAVDTSTSCIKPVMPVKQKRIVHGVHGGDPRVAQCPHERRSGARGEALWAPVGDRGTGVTQLGFGWRQSADAAMAL